MFIHDIICVLLFLIPFAVLNCDAIRGDDDSPPDSLTLNDLKIEAISKGALMKEVMGKSEEELKEILEELDSPDDFIEDYSTERKIADGLRAHAMLLEIDTNKQAFVWRTASEWYNTWSLRLVIPSIALSLLATVVQLAWPEDVWATSRKFTIASFAAMSVLLQGIDASCQNDAKAAQFGSAANRLAALTRRLDTNILEDTALNAKFIPAALEHLTMFQNTLREIMPSVPLVPATVMQLAYKNMESQSEMQRKISQTIPGLSDRIHVLKSRMFSEGSQFRNIVSPEERRKQNQAALQLQKIRRRQVGERKRFSASQPETKKKQTSLAQVAPDIHEHGRTSWLYRSRIEKGKLKRDVINGKVESMRRALISQTEVYRVSAEHCENRGFMLMVASMALSGVASVFAGSLPEGHAWGVIPAIASASSAAVQTVSSFVHYSSRAKLYTKGAASTDLLQKGLAIDRIRTLNLKDNDTLESVEDGLQVAEGLASEIEGDVPPPPFNWILEAMEQLNATNHRDVRFLEKFNRSRQWLLDD